jgi:surface-adhesin protein E
MYRERIDCRAHTYRTFGYLLYAKNGSVIDNVHTPDAEPEPIIPETVGDRFERLMCALAPQVVTAQKAAAEAVNTTPRTTEELRHEIEWMEARLRILREQLDAQTKQTAAPAPTPATEPAR